MDKKLMNKYYVERDVSWMYFNARILDAAQPGPPHRGAGTGANINKLYCIAPKRDKRKDRLPVATLEKLHAQLTRLTLEERMESFSLKPDRADTILVPTFGLADGIIRDLSSRG